MLHRVADIIDDARLLKTPHEIGKNVYA